MAIGVGVGLEKSSKGLWCVGAAEGRGVAASHELEPEELKFGSGVAVWNGLGVGVGLGVDVGAGLGVGVWNGVGVGVNTC